MSSQPPHNLPKPTLPPFWKWLMRITFAVTMMLFLAPAVYVGKYYALDRPREQAIADRGSAGDGSRVDTLLLLEKTARTPGSPADQQKAIHRIGSILRERGVNWKRPLECLSAKATLAELAAKAPVPAVRAAASEELEKVAQGGAVIRR